MGIWEGRGRCDASKKKMLFPFLLVSSPILTCFPSIALQALNYLNLVNKWKELGFPVQKIHNALKNTDKDNEAVIEYLTT